MTRHNNPRKTSTPVLAKPQVSNAGRLLDQLCEQIRHLHYSHRWGHVEIESFLTYLATARKVLVSTHLQALSALLLDGCGKRCHFA